MIVKYSKKFNTGPWLNEDIGFEIELEDTEGKPLPQAIQVTLGFLKEMAEKFHKDNNPQLTDAETIQWQTKPMSASEMICGPQRVDWSKVHPAPLQSIDPKKRDETEIAIDNCFLVEDLYKLKDAAVANGIVSHYERKLNHLQQFP